MFLASPDSDFQLWERPAATLRRFCRLYGRRDWDVASRNGRRDGDLAISRALNRWRLRTARCGCDGQSGKQMTVELEDIVH